MCESQSSKRPIDAIWIANNQKVPEEMWKSMEFCQTRGCICICIIVFVFVYYSKSCICICGAVESWSEPSWHPHQTVNLCLHRYRSAPTSWSWLTSISIEIVSCGSIHNFLVLKIATCWKGWLLKRRRQWWQIKLRCTPSLSILSPWLLLVQTMYVIKRQIGTGIEWGQNFTPVRCRGLETQWVAAWEPRQKRGAAIDMFEVSDAFDTPNTRPIFCREKILTCLHTHCT